MNLKDSTIEKRGGNINSKIMIVLKIIAAVVCALILFSVAPNKEAGEAHVIEPTPTPQIETVVSVKVINYSNFTYDLTEDERTLAERIVACEAGADTFAGQLAVAQCLFDSVMIDDTDLHTVFRDYGYSLYPREATQENKNAVSAVFDYGALVCDKPIQWFVTPAASSGSWHERHATFAGQYGAHLFYYNEDVLMRRNE